MNPDPPEPRPAAPTPPEPATREAIDRAGRLLANGQLVAFPTETVYGLGANALDETAVAGIFQAKGRPSFDPLIVHCSGPEQALALAASVPPAARQLAAAFWPGPMTLVLEKFPATGFSVQVSRSGSAPEPTAADPSRAGQQPHRPENQKKETANEQQETGNEKRPIPDLVTAGLPTVALRVPGHPVARAMIEAAGVPIAAPSANRFGGISPTRAEHVAGELGQAVAMILDGGPCEAGVESTVIAVSQDQPPRVLRLGGLTVEQIEQAVGPVTVQTSSSQPGQDEADGAAPGNRREPTPPHNDNAQPSPQAPGMLDRHYAPTTPLRIIADLTAEKLVNIAKNQRVAVLLFADRPELFEAIADYAEAWETLSPAGDLQEAAANLFAAMRRLDGAGVELILAEPAPDRGLGRAINDRLHRAAH
jgi:L-threonylcarbamoyladenylate synthase